MKKLLFIISFLSSLSSFSQEYPYSSGDTFYFNENAKIVAGQDVKLGAGSMPDGYFKYITQSRNNWAGNTSDPRFYSLNSKYSGHYAKVKSITQYGSRRRGFTDYLILGVGQMVNYECDVVNAIKSGELVVEGYNPENKNQVVIQQPVSKADELKKLKDLKDQGVLTEEEFQAEKKKILDK